MPALNIIDLSHHNTVHDLRETKKAGIVGVFHKATEGTSFVDKRFAERKRAAMECGLPFASYHFLKHGNVAAQIKHYLATAQPVKGERVVIDYEDESCTLDDLREAIAEIGRRDLSLQITVYAGHYLKQQLGDRRDEALAKTALWIAQYNNTGPKWPTGTWPTYSLWQFTDKATVAGIAPPTDGNEFNGSIEAAAKWFGPATDQPQPEPKPEPEPAPAVVEIAVTLPPGVSLKVTVNGAGWGSSS